MSNPKDRIISHMNKDHQLALLDYVVVYGQESASDINAESVIITDVSEDYLALSYHKDNGKANDLKLSWNDFPEDENVKVGKMADIKSKLVAMAKYAAGKQGYSHRKVDQVLFPSKPDLYFMYIFASAVALTLYDKTFVRRAIQRDGFLSGLLAKAPLFLASGYSLFENHIKTIAATTYGIHVIEVATVTWPKVSKYRMSLSKKLAWAFMNFIEGFVVFFRLNKLLDE